MKKKSLLLFVTVLFLTLLAACAPDREENAKKNTDADNESVEKPEELTVWANDEEKQLNAIEKIASDYEKKEGIKVNVVAKSMLDQLQELSLAGPEGKGPDIFFQPHDQTGNIVAQGLAEPINLSDENIAKYSDASIESVTYNFDGQTDIYGVPAVIETYGIFYNKDIVSEEPETIDDLKFLLEE